MKILYCLFMFLVLGHLENTVSLAQGNHGEHRQRLIGVRTKSAIDHAKILYFHSEFQKKLDTGLAKQHVLEIERVVEWNDKNIKALKKELSAEDLSLLKGDIEVMEKRNKDAGSVLKELLKELSKKKPEQGIIRDGVLKVYKYMQEVLNAHKAGEAKFGIVPPPEPVEDWRQ